MPIRRSSRSGRSSSSAAGSPLFTWGAYIGFSSFTLINKWTGWGGSDSIFSNIVIFLLTLIVAGLLVAILGIIIERLVIRPVYGSHLFQIFITVGAMIVLEELVRIVWGPNDEVMPVPLSFMGSWDLFDVVVAKYPLIAIVMGLILYLIIFAILRKTKLGTIVRAGVENPEMVQVMGHNIYRYCTGVFAVGSALAALGGGMWATFVKSIHPAMGGEVIVLAFIGGIIGGAYGIGGGAIIAPFCVVFFHLPIYTIAGATLMGTSITLVAGALFFSLLPATNGISPMPDWPLGILFGIGGLIGMYLGATSQKYVPQKFIKIFVGSAIVFLAIKYIAQYF